MEIIKGFTILLLTCGFLLLALSFVVNNMGKLHTNSDIHDICKRHITYLYIKHIDMLGTNFGEISKRRLPYGKMGTKLFGNRPKIKSLNYYYYYYIYIYIYIYIYVCVCVSIQASTEKLLPCSCSAQKFTLHENF